MAQRRREIGIRMALGALPEQIRRQFFSLGVRLLAMGTALGIVGAWISGRAMQSVLFGVPALHMTTLFITAAIMTVVTLVACVLPSHRAARDLSDGSPGRKLAITILVAPLQVWRPFAFSGRPR